MYNPGRFKGFLKNFQNMGCGWFALTGFLALFFVVPVLTYYIADRISEIINYFTGFDKNLVSYAIYLPPSIYSFFLIILSKTNTQFSAGSGLFIFSASYLATLIYDNSSSLEDMYIIWTYLGCGLIIFIIGILKHRFRKNKDSGQTT